jgi:hypothetical protein
VAEGSRLILVAWVAMGALHLGVSASCSDAPGLFYDEAIQAGPSLDFVRGGVRALHPPGLSAVSLLGRPFPWMTQPYMGALKSQLLIPSFALFEPSPAVLRTTTTLWALTGVLFVMLWAGRVLGRSVALVGGALLMADPTLLFVARHDWGSVGLALLCRGAGLYFASLGWSTRRPLHLALAGLAFGLGLYNKVDFAAFLGAAALALLAVRPGLLGEVRHRRELRWGALAFVVGAAPMVAWVPKLIQAAGMLETRGPFSERLLVAWSSLDGSYFYRLMSVGGRYEQLFDGADVPVGLLAIAVPTSLALLAALAWRAPRCLPSPRALVFVVIAGGLSQLALLAMPGAQRVHHMMNVQPFPQLLVASALVALWRVRPDGVARYVARAAAGTALVALLAADARVVARTFDLLEASGGRGYWSDALERFAEDVEVEPAATVVSLDWGFHPPLLLLTRTPRLLEPIWHIRRGAGPDRGWRHEGDADHLYLVHDSAYDRFGYGPDFLAQVAELPPGFAETRVYRDREGAVAFLAIRLTRPHRLFFQGRLRLSMH